VKHEIKSFGIVQTSIVMALIYAIISEVLSWFFAIGAIAHGHPLRAILLIIGLPILYGVMGFISVAIFCWLYNEIASRIGGMTFELAPRDEI
jgi:hypothetical protein